MIHISITNERGDLIDGFDVFPNNVNRVSFDEMQLATLVRECIEKTFVVEDE